MKLFQLVSDLVKLPEKFEVYSSSPDIVVLDPSYFLVNCSVHIVESLIYYAGPNVIVSWVLGYTSESRAATFLCSVTFSRLYLCSVTMGLNLQLLLNMKDKFIPLIYNIHIF